MPSQSWWYSFSNILMAQFITYFRSWLIFHLTCRCSHTITIFSHCFLLSTFLHLPFILFVYWKPSENREIIHFVECLMHRKLPISVLNKSMISFSPNNTPTVLLERLLQMRKWNNLGPCHTAGNSGSPTPEPPCSLVHCRSQRGTESRSQGISMEFISRVMANDWGGSLG